MKSKNLLLVFTLLTVLSLQAANGKHDSPRCIEGGEDRESKGGGVYGNGGE